MSIEVRKKNLEELLAQISERLLRSDYCVLADGRRRRPADAEHQRRRDLKRLNALCAQLYEMEDV